MNFVPTLDYCIGSFELAVEFERSRLNPQGPGCCPGLCRLVDDADFHSELGEPERQDQACGTGADDENVAVLHFVLRSSASPAIGSSRPRSAVRACCSASACKSGGLAPTPPKTSRNSTAITIGPISEKA